MTDFEKGIEYAFDFIEKNMIGRVLSGSLEEVVTREMLKNLKKRVPKRCNFCNIPCGDSWCSTKSKK